MSQPPASSDAALPDAARTAAEPRVAGTSGGSDGRGGGHAAAAAPRGVHLAYAALTSTRDAVAAVAGRLGWTPALLTHPGYAGPEGARVLGRVLLAPRGTEPSQRVGLPGWRRFLTLELPDQAVDVHLGGVVASVRSDDSGVLDAVVDVELPPGESPVLLRCRAGRRCGASSTQHRPARCAGSCATSTTPSGSPG